MLAVRLHLDRATKENGALRVIPGSHRVDDLSMAEVPANPESAAVYCEAEAGDVLLMYPLLIHGSPKPVNGMHRRILHLEIAGPMELPDGFKWYDE